MNNNDYTESGILGQLESDEPFHRLFPPTIILYHQEGGALAIGDQGGFVPSRREWEAIRARIDSFYASIDSADIADHNHALYEQHGLLLDSPRLRDAAKPQKTKIPKALRQKIFQRDDFTCQHCGATERLSVDHVYPESAGGTLDESNLQTLCTPCNSRKGAQIG
jgi:hypothetical protein